MPYIDPNTGLTMQDGPEPNEEELLRQEIKELAAASAKMGPMIDVMRAAVGKLMAQSAGPVRKDLPATPTIRVPPLPVARPDDAAGQTNAGAGGSARRPTINVPRPEPRDELKPGWRRNEDGSFSHRPDLSVIRADWKNAPNSSATPALDRPQPVIVVGPKPLDVRIMAGAVTGSDGRSRSSQPPGPNAPHRPRGSPAPRSAGGGSVAAGRRPASSRRALRVSGRRGFGSGRRAPPPASTSPRSASTPGGRSVPAPRPRGGRRWRGRRGRR